VPGALLAVELLWLAPARPPVGVALAKLSLYAEPRTGLEAIASVKPGVTLAIVGGGEGEWLRVAAGDRTGFAPRAQIAPVE
jgi:SH3-like domain-containing protein